MGGRTNLSARTIAIRAKVDAALAKDYHRSDRDVAAEVGCNYKTVQDARRRLGVPVVGPLIKVPDDVYQRLGKKCGWSKQKLATATAKWREANRPMLAQKAPRLRPLPAFKSAPPVSCEDKLYAPPTTILAAWIDEELRTGWDRTNKAIAQVCGCHPEYVRNRRKGRTRNDWKGCWRIQRG